jgi:gluconate 2-dehydrogenase alpha chain
MGFHASQRVGKHYMSHIRNGVMGQFPFDLNRWYGTPVQGTSLDDWADDNFDHTGDGFIGGGNLLVTMEAKPIEAASMSTFGKPPRWGSDGRRL